jgi:IclR family pca regulon transcriptional regulator
MRALDSAAIDRLSPARGSLTGPGSALGDLRYSQGLGRGLAILGCFSRGQYTLSISDLSEILRMPRSTTHRYVATLVKLGYLLQLRNKKYRLHAGVIQLGMAAVNEMSLAQHSEDILAALSYRTGFTASVAVLDEADVLYIARVSFGRRQEVPKGDGAPSVGGRLPAYCTALGKVLLARLPEPDLLALLGGLRLISVGPHTITSTKRLRGELELVAKKWLAVGDEELRPNWLSIAAPLRTYGGDVVAALALSADARVISVVELRTELAPHLLAAADEISNRLGFRRDESRVIDVEAQG